MPRPRNSQPRDYQVNLRYTVHEYARIHRNASIAGKTLTEFGRAVMLRRPRPTRKSAPRLIELPPRMITRWHAAGLRLNSLAHRMNASDTLGLPELPIAIRDLRSLLRRSFAQLSADTETAAAYMLHPAVRYHLRRICTNLVQIADRYRSLGSGPPVPLSNLIGRFRLILAQDRHDP
jgi:hypothetical protein